MPMSSRDRCWVGSDAVMERLPRNGGQFDAAVGCCVGDGGDRERPCVLSEKCVALNKGVNSVGSDHFHEAGGGLDDGPAAGPVPEESAGLERAR